MLTRDLPIDFRAFLERHAEAAAGVAPMDRATARPSTQDGRGFVQHKTAAVSLYRAAFREHVTPLEPAVLDDLRLIFPYTKSPAERSDERFDQAARAFRAPRFQALYRAWLQRGEPVLNATLSPVLSDHLRWGTGQMECHVLPYPYARLLSLVGTA